MQRLLIWIFRAPCRLQRHGTYGQATGSPKPNRRPAPGRCRPPLPATKRLAGHRQQFRPSDGCRTGQDTAATIYIASGNEPGWQLQISGDRHLSLDTVSASAGPLPAMDAQAGNGRRYRGELEGHALQLDIRPGPCQDDMTGMPRPDTVRLQLDQRQLHGCGGDPRDLFAGGGWHIVAMDGQAVADGQQGSLEFDREGRVSGRAFCNRFSAAYQLTGEGLTIGPAAATKMACEPPAMDLERRLLDLLSQVTRFSIDDERQLVLHTGGGAALTARR